MNRGDDALERSAARLRDETDLANALYVIRCAWGRHTLTRKEALALAEAYLKAKSDLFIAQVEAQRLADDASAQRALVEQLTNELDKHQKGNS